jgi:hypothetical protein
MRLRRIHIFSLLAFAGALPAHAFADTDLFCSGLATTYSANVNLSSVSEVGNAELRIHLSDKAATLTLPPIMSATPALEIDEVAYTDTAITAQGPTVILGYRVTLNIDRNTGYVRLITHYGNEFTGTCRKYDPTVNTKLF